MWLVLCRLEPGSPRSCPDAYEVTVNEEVIVPLAPAVRAAPLKARKRDEVRAMVASRAFACMAGVHHNRNKIKLQYLQMLLSFTAQSPPQDYLTTAAASSRREEQPFGMHSDEGGTGTMK